MEQPRPRRSEHAAPDAPALVAALGRIEREAAMLIYLDPERSIIGVRHIMGQRRSVAVPIRTAARDALAFAAAAVIVAHSHPGDDPAPSRADLAFTRSLARGLEALEVRLVDHLIVSGEKIVSLRELGIL